MRYCRACGDDAHDGPCDPQSRRATENIGGEPVLTLLAHSLGAELVEPHYPEIEAEPDLPIVYGPRVM